MTSLPRKVSTLFSKPSAHGKMGLPRKWWQDVDLKELRTAQRVRSEVVWAYEEVGGWLALGGCIPIGIA